MRKETKYIIIHCSATRPSQDIGFEEIDRWHRAKGWLSCGYHKIIRRNRPSDRRQPNPDTQPSPSRIVASWAYPKQTDSMADLLVRRSEG